MKMNMKSLTYVAVAFVGAVSIATSALAQTPVSSIDELIQRVGKDSREAQAEANRRVQEFRSRGAEQRTLLNAARAELNTLRGQERRNSTQFDINEAAIAELDGELRLAQGSFGELFGAARQAAGELATTLNASYVSGQYPGRAEALDRVATSNTLPEVAELENIYTTMISEMQSQGEVVTFTGRLAELDNVEITRAGTFLAWTADKAEFIQMDEGVMLKLGRQPSGRIRGLARNVSNGSPTEIVKGPIDPVRGELLAMVVRTPSLVERFHAGGGIGYAVTTMAAVGIFLGLWRFFVLSMTGMAVRAQARKAKPGNNPLGRVMAAYEAAKERDLETIELKLDDAIIKETGKLEFGISLIKVLAAVSPLMGLLGTVIGMIQTFQAITLFGAGDPQLMADGISFALVTTVLGLLSAIPLLLLHSFCASAARSVQQVLEEQASGLIASNAEKRSQ
ncbi:MAG: MotA/TolQ/ExbB proton channel family protein [Robiginitomaculum sp.]|nr:MotA/TolQ/ExbB proton channel family protein [Robiginitomaculum sp.]